MKHILVTGSNGFIGRTLVLFLERQGYSVVHFNTRDGDIADTDFIDKFKQTKLDYVFHLAGKTFVPDSWIHPSIFYKTTLLGTQNILELCRDKDIPMTFVSAYLYGAPALMPISEKTPLKPNNPYAHSKFLSEEICEFYSQNFNVKVSIARPFNVYGLGQKGHFLIPHIIKQVLSDNKINVKSLSPKRDYLYLDDLVDGLIYTMSTKKNFSIYNFGSGEEYSVQEIIDFTQKIAGTRKPVVSENIDRKNEIMHVVADISKAKSELNWKPKISFIAGLTRILQENQYE